MSDEIQLTDDEVLALATLARYLMQADGIVSRDEIQSMKGIGRTVGLVKFSDALEKAKAAPPMDGAQLLKLARTFKSQDKAVFVFTQLADLANSDGIADVEKKVLDALAATWGLSWSAE